jgi:hypothetical protein
MQKQSETLDGHFTDVATRPQRARQHLENGAAGRAGLLQGLRR